MMEQEFINRKIIISQFITDALAGDVIAMLLAIDDYDVRMAQTFNNYKPEPIEIFINSGGGSATAGNAIITAMEMVDTPIITYGVGMVASMALAIFISGDIRIASRLARFMYHSVSYGAEGNIKDHEDSMKEANILQDYYNDIFLDKTKFTKEMMERIREKKKDFFFSGSKAVKLGVADEMLEKPEKKFELLTEEEVKQLEKEINI